MENILGNIFVASFGVVFLLPFIAVILERLERNKKRKSLKKS
jgi:hypothetical protein